MRSVTSHLILSEIAIMCMISAAFVLNDSSTVYSRALLIVTLATILAALCLTSFLKNEWGKEKHVLVILAFASLFFLLWRCTFFNSSFFNSARGLNSEAVLFSIQYTEAGKLVFSSAHSYFFADALIVGFLHDTTGMPLEAEIVVLYAVYATLVTLLSFLLWKTTLQEISHEVGIGKAALVLPTIISFLLTGVAYSERTHLTLALTLMVSWLIFTKGVKNIKSNVILLLLVVAVTFGDVNGLLVFIPLFSLYSILGKQKATIIYAVIPLGYLTFSANAYALALKSYAAQVYVGFGEFIRNALLGEVSESILPWQKVNARLQSDTYVTSLAYLSLLVTALIVVVLSIFLWTKERGTRKIRKRDPFNQAGLICLLLLLCLSVLTYVGVSGAETASSDIRTIAVVLLSLLLPFLLIRRRLMSYISSSRILALLIILFIALASIRTVYEVYPKSASDPIYVLEDVRLGGASVDAVGGFLNNYYKTGGIVADYKVLNRVGKFLPSPQYATRELSAATLNMPFSSFPNRSVLVFDIGATKYPSLYDSPDAYQAAQNFADIHNRIFDNGVVVVASK